MVMVKDNDLTHERDLVEQLTGALRFILAFYEPGQRYLDTEAWKCAEAGGRAALAKGEAALLRRSHSRNCRSKRYD